MFDNSSAHSLRKEIRAYELILQLRRHLLLVIIASLVVFALAWYYSGPYFQYESKVLVDVSPAPVFIGLQENTRQPIEIFKNSEYVMRVLQFVHSNSMTDVLEKKFGLYRHYGIDPASPYAYERLNSILFAFITVKKSPYENVVISVRDRDRDFAANMANQVAEETDNLARAYFIQSLKVKIDFYEQYHQNLIHDFDDKIAKVDEALRQAGRGNNASEAEKNLMTNSTHMSSLIDQIAELQRSQSWIETLMGDKQYRFVTVTQQAQADQSNPAASRLTFAFFAMATAAVLSVLVAYFAMTYRRYFQLFFLRRIS